MLPAVFGALALTGNAVSGRVTFGLGMLFGLAALVAVYAWPADRAGRPVLPWLRIAAIVLLTALTTAASGVAGLFLGLVAAALWLTGDRRLSYAVGLPPVAVVAVSAWLFPLSGEQPMAWYSAILPTVAGLSAVLLFPREWRMLRVLGLVYLLAVQLAWLVPSPVGTNISRLGLIFAGVGLVATLPGRAWVRSFAAARLGRTITAGLVGAALITSVSWQVGLAARDAINTAPPDVAEPRPRAARPGAGRPRRRARPRRGGADREPPRGGRAGAVRQPRPRLEPPGRRRPQPGLLPRPAADGRGLPALAEPLGGALRGALHREAGRRRRRGGRARLGGLPYLERVWSDDEWTLYEVQQPRAAGVLARAGARPSTPRRSPSTPPSPDPSSSASPTPAGSACSTTDAAGRLPGPTSGRQPCLSGLAADRQIEDPRDNWLVLHAPEAGVYRIGAPYKVPRGSACSS